MLFLEFLFYHVMFFFFLGPLINLVIIFFRGHFLVYNFNFWGFNREFFLQCFFYAITCFTFYYYFYHSCNFLSFIEIYLLFSAGIIRTFILSIRYSTMDAKKIDSFFHIKLEYKDKMSEFTLNNWRKQTDEVIEQELKTLVRLKNLDLTFFRFLFLSEINSIFENELIGIDFFIEFMKN